MDSRILNEKNKRIVLELLDDFIKSEQEVINQGERYPYEKFDEKRVEVIETLTEHLNPFFRKEISVTLFKTKVDGINKRNPLWGFRGVNGQMFFNMLHKCSPNKEELHDKLINWLRVPEDIGDSKQKIQGLSEYVKQISVNISDKRKAPRPKSILFFLSYFWQLQEPDKFPIFYNSLESTLLELEILKQKDKLNEYYEEFYNINEEARELFKDKTTKNVNLWFIEHVFWRYYNLNQEAKVPGNVQKKIIEEKIKVSSYLDYVPPIISNITALSKNESSPADFEKATEMLFTMLGFDVELRGQGSGRMVDVIARANLGRPYILLIDCKARSKEDFSFNAGEERKVSEHIDNFEYQYPRDSKVETHYLIVSSGFKKGDENVRRKIKGETGTDVSLISVDSLLFLLAKKLQDWTFDLKRMRKIFQREGLITNDVIQDIIGR